MNSIPFTEVRARLADALREVDVGGQPLLISRRGHTAAVLMSWSHYRDLSSGPAGFADRLARWRADELSLAVPAEGTQDQDPFAGLRDADPGRPANWADQEG
jgi:prevent-host-death family protein